jgi:hypothetical protein
MALTVQKRNNAEYPEVSSRPEAGGMRESPQECTGSRIVNENWQWRFASDEIASIGVE